LSREGNCMRLDAKTIAALDLGGRKDMVVFDEALPRFGYRLRRSHDGSKMLRSFLIQYRRAGASRRMSISADAVRAEPARAWAEKNPAKVALGDDPQEQRVDRRNKDRVTLRFIIGEYLADKKDDVRKRTFIQVQRYLTGPYFRALHAMPIDTV